MIWMLALGMLLSVVAVVAIGTAAGHRGFPVPDINARIGFIDGLRGYLALAVMFHHFDIWINVARRGAPWGTSSTQWLSNLGPGGVVLFFMTTGLVFYSRIDKGFAATNWRTTYISRLFRILPLQIVVILAIAAISLTQSGAIGNKFLAVKSLAMWVTSYGEPPLFGYEQSNVINAKVFWSLWYEWLFYFLVLPIMALGRDWTRRWLPGFVLPLILLMIGLIIGPIVTPVVKLFSVIFYLPFFALGMLAYELRVRQVVAQLLASRLAAALATVGVAAAVILAHGPYALPQLLAYALFFACVACGNSFFGLLTLRGSFVLGECSFGIYVIHGIILFVLFSFAIPRELATPFLPLLMPVAAILSVLLSIVAHLMIERPMIHLGRQFGRARARTAVERASLDVAP